MGAVQKLATVVIIGLTALATLLVFLAADEPNRRDAELSEQEHVAIERGIQTYITNCLSCHGPAGEGLKGESGYVGLPIGGNTSERLINQTDDPVLRAEREDQIRTRIHGGSPIGCGTVYPQAPCAMPPWGEDFGGELNDEQIEELVLMIQNVDWDLVYNEAIAANGGEYPAPPAPPDTGAGQGEGEGEGETGAAVRLEGYDIGWRTADQPGPMVDLVLPPGATIELVNVGAAGHNFQAEDLGINEDMPVGYSGTVTIPADAAPGTYEFICNVPGHAAAGMVGTITIDPNATAGGGEASPEASPGATPEAAPAGDDGGAAQTVRLEGYDIGWRTEDQAGPQVTLTVAPGATIQLVNVGASPHNFEAADLGINQDMPVGYDGTITIPADTPPGEYEFICNVPGHAAAGMVGTLIIE